MAAGVLPGSSPIDGEYEDDDDDVYDDEDYETIVDKKPEVKIVKQEDLKTVSDATTEAAPSTKPAPSETTSNAPGRHHSSASKSYNLLNAAEKNKIFSQHSPSQNQQAAIPIPNGKYHLRQTQNGKSKTHSSLAESTPTEAPTTTSTTSTTTTTTPKPRSITTTRHLPTKHVLNLHQNHNAEDEAPTTDKSPNSYVTVTKSVTGSMDESKSPPEDKQKFASTYYTKSSTCGYFTSSCNTVYGKNGRGKICRKAPTKGKC